MKTTMKMVFLSVVMAMGTSSIGCIEDGPLPPATPDATVPVTPDATPPATPDATTPVVPDATVLTPDATPVAPDATPPATPDASVPDAATPSVDAAPVTPDASVPDTTPVAPDATPACDCTSNADCGDGFNWTGDWCVAGECTHSVNDCGGMQVRTSATATSCSFWGGFGTPEPAPPLGAFVPSSLPAGPAGGDWKAAPEHACSVICYNSGGVRVPLDITIEWNGATNTPLHRTLAGLLKGTFDGLHLE